MLKTFFLALLISTHASAHGSVMIEQVIQDYFQGYQKAETKLIKKAFHSETRLLSVDNGQLDKTEMSDWLKSLEDRKARGDIRQGELKVLSIDQTDDTAIVKLTIDFPKFKFTDSLSLLKIQEKWLIVGKIYSVKEK